MDDISSTQCKLLLAVPDKNLMFDYYRPLSTLGDVFLAHVDQYTYDNKVRLDALYFGSTKSGIVAWDKSIASEPGLPTPMTSEFEILRELQDQNIVGLSRNAYIDRHRWVFSPAVFEDVITKLFLAGLINWRIVKVEAGLGCEFLVVLEKGSRSEYLESETNSETRASALIDYMPEKFEMPLSITSNQIFSPLDDTNYRFSRISCHLLSLPSKKVSLEVFLSYLKSC